VWASADRPADVTYKYVCHNVVFLVGFLAEVKANLVTSIFHPNIPIRRTKKKGRQLYRGHKTPTPSSFFVITTLDEPVAVRRINRHLTD
jgi:hypothetical protein